MDDACAVIVINLSNITCIAAVRAKLYGGQEVSGSCNPFSAWFNNGFDETVHPQQCIIRALTYHFLGDMGLLSISIYEDNSPQTRLQMVFSLHIFVHTTIAAISNLFYKSLQKQIKSNLFSEILQKINCISEETLHTFCNDKIFISSIEIVGEIPCYHFISFLNAIT